MKCAAPETPARADAAERCRGAIRCPGTLVIGYGNTLRSDDGAGPALAALLQDDILKGGGTVIAAHQLLPEHAEMVSHADLAIFIDASAADPPGWVTLHTLTPRDEPVAPHTLGHHLTPQSILTLAATLFARAPRAILISIGTATLDHGDTLSPEVTAALPRARTLILTHLAGRH